MVSKEMIEGYIVTLFDVTSRVVVNRKYAFPFLVDVSLKFVIVITQLPLILLNLLTKKVF